MPCQTPGYCSNDHMFMLMIAETSARNMTFLPISSPNMQPTLHISIAAVYSEEVSTTWETQRSKIEWQSFGDVLWEFSRKQIFTSVKKSENDLLKLAINYFASFTVAFHLPQASEIYLTILTSSHHVPLVHDTTGYPHTQYEAIHHPRDQSLLGLWKQPRLNDSNHSGIPC